MSLLACALALSGAGGLPVQHRIILHPHNERAGPWSAADGPEAPLLFADASIDGRRATAMVDTGVTFTTLDVTWARRAGLRTDGPAAVTLSATGGPVRAALGPLVDMVVAPYRISKLQTLAVDMAAIRRATPPRIDVMLGMDVIGAGSLELDLGNRRWRMGRGGLVWPQAATAPLRYTADRYHSYVEIAVEGKLLRLGVDTGYDGSLMLSGSAATLAGLFGHDRSTTIASQGLGGIEVQQMAILPRLHFGAIELTDVPVEVERTNGLPTQWQLDGVIGTRLLARLHAALDFPAGVMFYVASNVPAPSPVRSTIGLQVRRQDAELAVLHVMANGPAAAAGWQAGERICAVDGQAIAAMPQTAGPNRWNVALPGTKVRFGMCDGTSRLLTARAFY